MRREGGGKERGKGRKAEQSKAQVPCLPKWSTEEFYKSWGTSDLLSSEDTHKRYHDSLLMKPSTSSDKDLRERTSSNWSPHLFLFSKCGSSTISIKKHTHTHFYLTSISWTPTQIRVIKMSGSWAHYLRFSKTMGFS